MLQKSAFNKCNGYIFLTCVGSLYALVAVDLIFLYIRNTKREGSHKNKGKKKKANDSVHCLNVPIGWPVDNRNKKKT